MPTTRPKLGVSSARISIASIAVFIMWSVSAVEGRQCFWCGPLADQVHRSRRAPACQAGAPVTLCEPGYDHCATVATAPPYVESRYCVKLYQDECYPLFCNSTKTWRMVCPCRGDLCNGPNRDRETEAFILLSKLAAKSRIIKRAVTPAEFIQNIKTKIVNPEEKDPVENPVEMDDDITLIVNQDDQTAPTHNTENKEQDQGPISQINEATVLASSSSTIPVSEESYATTIMNTQLAYDELQTETLSMLEIDIINPHKINDFNNAEDQDLNINILEDRELCPDNFNHHDDDSSFQSSMAPVNAGSSNNNPKNETSGILLNTGLATETINMKSREPTAAAFEQDNVDVINTTEKTPYNNISTATSTHTPAPVPQDHKELTSSRPKGKGKGNNSSEKIHVSLIIIIISIFLFSFN